MSRHPLTRLLLVLGVSGLALLPAPARAQSATTGAIAGAVTDSTGGVLPGVTVEAASAALIEKVRSAVTDARGRYNIVDLRPGTYTVTFTLGGFNVVRREGLELTTGFTATVDAELRVGSLQETVTVTGASPVVDVQNVRQRNVLGREALDTLPTGKTIQGYAALTVGVQVSGAGQDVGGNRNESAGALQIHGGRQGDQHLWIDGMRQNLGFSTGGGTIRLYMTSQANVQEVTLETSGMGAESETGGIQINVVPKEGGNALRGFANGAYTGEHMQNRNFTPELASRGLTTGASVKKIYDYSGGVGGPIKHDRLWFFTSSRWWGADEFAPGNYFNKTPHTLFYTPDLTRPAYTHIYNRDHSIRLTWQAAARQKVTFSSGHQNNCLCYFQVDQNIAPEAIVHQRYEPIHFEQGTWTYTATNRLLVQAGATWARNNRRGMREEGVSRSDIAVTELSTGYRYGAAAGIAYNPEREAYGVLQRMDQTNGKLSVSYVTGSHAFKSGLFWFVGFANQALEGQDPPVSYTLRNQLPVQVTYYASPNFYMSRGRALGLFAQDQWTIDRLTLNLGVRFDSLYGWNPEQTRPAGAFVPAYHFSRMNNLPNWKDMAPRIGGAYDLFGNGKTSIKASLGRYIASEMTGIAISTNPANSIVTSATRTWTDANSDYVGSPGTELEFAL